MKVLSFLWTLVDPASQGHAYQRMKPERLPKLDTWFNFRLTRKWAYKRY